MKGKKSSLIVLPEMVVLQPTVVNVSNPVENVPAEGVDEGFNLGLAEDLQNEIVSDEALKVGVLRSKLERIEYGELCIHPDSLYYMDCVCYNSRFCRKKCDYRNKSK
jgi:hypothetical protein